jgi:hypothetical protein
MREIFFWLRLWTKKRAEVQVRKRHQLDHLSLNDLGAELSWIDKGVIVRWQLWFVILHTLFVTFVYRASHVRPNPIATITWPTIVDSVLNNKALIYCLSLSYISRVSVLIFRIAEIEKDNAIDGLSGICRQNRMIHPDVAILYLGI